ncbi:hypothetical protein, partial [Salinisphaera sp.]|uniref:hypothetical protein n=1 Tax=Salinisphaera sp. TaxID=1914330 RepID=UPI002D78966A
MKKKSTDARGEHTDERNGKHYGALLGAAGLVAKSVVKNKQDRSAPWNYDDALNTLASEIADVTAKGMEQGKRVTLYLTGDVGRQFQKLVRYQLEQQKKQGEPTVLNDAIKKAKKDLYAR